jgi:hypothetical protein
VADATCSEDGCGKPVRGRGWCGMHYARWSKYSDPQYSKYHRVPMAERFWLWVDKRGPDECWPWTGYITKRGYGQFCIDRHSSSGAHRLAYILTVGRIPDGLQIDHMCHERRECQLGNNCPHRRCCNPAHLKPATNRVNALRGNAPTAVNARKTHCIRKHEFTPANTRINRDGGRSCRACERIRDAKKRAARRAARALAA